MPNESASTVDTNREARPVRRHELASALEHLFVEGMGLTALALTHADGARDLTLMQWRALVVTSQRDGIRIGEIALRLGLAVPSASRLVRRLETRGLVTTARDETDRRATLVHLTLAGSHVHDAVFHRRQDLLSTALFDGSIRWTEGHRTLVDDLARSLSRYG